MKHYLRTKSKKQAPFAELQPPPKRGDGVVV